MVSKNTRCKVTNITRNILFVKTDTGLDATVRLVDLMLNPEIYEAEVLIKGICYRVPVYNEDNGQLISKQTVTPFTHPKHAYTKAYTVRDVVKGVTLNWCHGFEESHHDVIQFITEEFANAYVDTVLENDRNRYKIS